MFWLASIDDKGLPTISGKRAAPGAVNIINGCTLVFPNYDGNGM